MDAVELEDRHYNNQHRPNADGPEQLPDPLLESRVTDLVLIPGARLPVPPADPLPAPRRCELGLQGLLLLGRVGPQLVQLLLLLVVGVAAVVRVVAVPEVLGRPLFDDDRVDVGAGDLVEDAVPLDAQLARLSGERSWTAGFEFKHSSGEEVQCLAIPRVSERVLRLAMASPQLGTEFRQAAFSCIASPCTPHR